MKVLKRIALGIGLLVILAIAFGPLLLRSLSDLIIDKVEQLYGKEHCGALNIGGASLSLVRNFPSLTVSLQGISLTDTLYAEHPPMVFEAETARLVASPRKLIRRELAIQKLVIRSGKLELDQFEPIVKVGNILFKKEHLEKIEFAPLINTVRLEDQTMEIPRMEVQSTAFGLFLGGRFGFEDSTNLWISFPWENFNKRDFVDPPKKEGYLASGQKLFVEVREYPPDKTRYFLHLSNKKMFEQLGDPELYQEERERVWAFRKQQKNAAKNGQLSTDTIQQDEH